MVFSLITLYGSNIGSLVRPILSASPVDRCLEESGTGSLHRRHQRFSLHPCPDHQHHHLSDPLHSQGPHVTSFLHIHRSMLVPISTFGLVAIIVSYAVLVMWPPIFDLTSSFGWSKYKPSFVAADLWPVSFADLLQNIGLFVYCMGFILFLLTQYVLFFHLPHG